MDLRFEPFLVTRLPDGRLHLETALEGECRLYWSAFPAGFCDDNDLGAFRGAADVEDPLPGRRCYFHIFRGSRWYVAAQKLWFVEGLENLRELGGYETADRRAFVRPGAFYRSDRLCSLTERGQEQFRRLHIRQIVDFRVPSEIEGREDPEFEDTGRLNVRPIPPGSSCFRLTLHEILHEPVGVIVEARDTLFRQYREMPFGSDAYRAFFALVKENKTPLLFHCSAGKDRTGVAAALLLLALGIPRDTIVYDYLLTQEASKASIERIHRECGAQPDPDIRQAIEVFISVRRDSIESTLDAIAARYGDDLPAFFARELGVTGDDLAALRQRYLIRHCESEETPK